MAAVAHVSYLGGGIFLPDHGPGDRHTIIEYVGRLLRAKQKVQVLLDNQRWLVQLGEHVCCARCGLTTDISCREANDDGEPCCLRCALSPARPEMPARVTPQHLTLALAQT
jgi:hypothetical protein